MTFQSPELNKLVADLGDAGPRVGRRVAEAVRDASRRVRAAARRNAPRRTGALAESIDVDFFGQGNSRNMVAVVGPSLHYGLFQEYGTAKMAPHPFMGPAFVAELPRLQADIEKAVEGVL